MSGHVSTLDRLKPRLLAAAAGAAVATLLVVLGWTARLDHQVFDALSRLGAPDPDPRIAIVSIDPESLAELGRWPWSRRIHARLVDRLTGVGARGIALDVLLSESALFDPEGDALLARALARSGRVVLPVYADARDGAAVELMPVPEFAATAAALGHVDHVADGDGEVRSLYLRAGVGNPRWPSLALAIQRLDDSEASGLDEPPGARTLQGRNPDPQQWVRDYRVMLPDRHRPGAYEHMSYLDVLEGRVPDARLRGRWLLVNLPLEDAATGSDAAADTAPGPADMEFQASALDALVNGQAVVPLGLGAQTVLSILLAATPLLLGGLGPARLRGQRVAGAWLLAFAMLAVLLSWLLMRWGHAWFAPAPALLVLATAGAVWAARRLREHRQAAQSDPATGLATRPAFERQLLQELRDARRSGQPLSLLFLQVDAAPANGANVAPAQPLLRGFADNLRGRARRPRDLVARLDVDSFAVLLPETTPQAAAAIATTIHVDLANRAVSAGGDRHACTTSVGIDTYRGDQELTAAEFLARAETACARARRDGGSRTVLQGEASLQVRPA